MNPRSERAASQKTHSASVGEKKGKSEKPAAMPVSRSPIHGSSRPGHGFRGSTCEEHIGPGGAVGHSLKGAAMGLEEDTCGEHLRALYALEFALSASHFKPRNSHAKARPPKPAQRPSFSRRWQGISSDLRLFAEGLSRAERGTGLKASIVRPPPPLGGQSIRTVIFASTLALGIPALQPLVVPKVRKHYCLYVVRKPAS